MLEYSHGDEAGRNDDRSLPRERIVRGELHELRLNILRRQKVITRVLQQAQAKLAGLQVMERRRQELEHELKHLSEGQR